MRSGIRVYSRVVLAVLAFALAPLRVGAQSAPQVARSADGVVVAAQPLAAAAGARMLELGGNAADAAIAAAFAISVVEPSMNSIGGRNQILIRTPDGGVAGIDGTTSVPLGYDPSTAPRAAYGYPTIGVPGSVAGLMRLHEEYGTLPLTTIMAPAIDYAAHGFRLLPGEARRQAGSRVQVAESEGARRYYLKADGSPYSPGDRLVQSDMAATLRAISLGGGDAFYRGEIAGRIADDMAANGGFLTREALAAYEAEDSRIVRGSYRGFEIVGSDIPASGAIAILALQIAEVFDPDSMGDEAWASVIAQSLALAMAEYRRPSSDSSAVRVTSKALAHELSEQVRVPAEATMESGAAEPWAAAGAGRFRTRRRGRGPGPAAGGWPHDASFRRRRQRHGHRAHADDRPRDGSEGRHPRTRVPLRRDAGRLPGDQRAGRARAVRHHAVHGPRRRRAVPRPGGRRRHPDHFGGRPGRDPGHR